MLTDEQELVATYVENLNKSGKQDVVLINAVAGSGKTHLLTNIAKRVPHSNALYFCYNKSVAVESKKKFPKTTNCLTSHSLAYQAVVNPYNLTVGTFSFRDIKEKMEYVDKLQVVDIIRNFCLSSHVDFSSYAEDALIPISKRNIAAKYLKAMEEGKIECTHDFYLKYFHLMLYRGELDYDPFDFIMVDECGDLNPVTLEIIKTLPSKIKILVGDKHQNIYSFNNTVNAFEHIEGTSFDLTETFRVPKNIASDIEVFCKKYIDPNMKFTGVKEATGPIVTKAFIARSNATLIDKMIELNAQGKKYGLVRKAAEIFKLPLTVASLKRFGKISNPEYTHLQEAYDHYYDDSTINKAYKTPFAYLARLYANDLQLKSAITLVLKHGKGALFEALEEAKKHENSKQDYLLLTSHSSKGLQFDEVVLSECMNYSIDTIVELINQNPDTVLTKDQKESLRLYYVACTRTEKVLINAQHL